MKLLVVILLTVLAVGCGKRPEKAVSAASIGEVREPDGTVVIPPGSPKLEQLKIAAAADAEVPTDEVTSPAKIELNPNLVSHIVMPVAGRVVSVAVRLGDAVSAGDTLLAIESPDADAAQAAFLQAEAGVSQAQANLLKARADLERTQDLYQHNAIARKEVLAAENAVAQSTSVLDQSRAAREQALRRVRILGLKEGQFGEKVLVRAPISGKVMDIAVAQGEYRNDTNAVLMTIADLSTVWAAADVPEAYIRFVQVGEPVEVRLAAFPGEVFRARVKRIADAVDPQTRTIKVRAEMQNAHGRLRPEMFGTVRHIESTRILPVVPVGAVMQDNGRAMVWREIGPGRFRPVEVKTAPRTGDVLPLVAGIRAGERVVVDGAMLLKAQ